MNITAGVWYQNSVRPVTMTFRNDGDDLFYCDPDDATKQDLDLIRHASTIKAELLYPMSGLESEEPILKPGRIDVLLGIGRTAEVLRNLCLMVSRDSREDWDKIKHLMHRLFKVSLGDPSETPRGAVELSYNQEGAKVPFDLSQAGRGLQQMLLILAYLYAHKSSILMVDEPDAHLEILRQRQIYILLRDIARECGSQIVLATHSEVILEEALDTNLVLLLEGKADNLAQKQNIKNSLKHFGAEHYLRARARRYVLYVEGGTDLEILRALAIRLDHPAAKSWDERINAFYVENNYPLADTESELERVEGGFGITPREHFRAMRELVPGLRGLAILDNDGANRKDSSEGALRTLYWRRYEAENYFVTPELLRTHALSLFKETPLFEPQLMPRVDETLEELIREQVFPAEEDYRTWQSAESAAGRLLWTERTRNLKLSEFAEEYYRRLARRTGLPMLLRKGELHRLVGLAQANGIDPDVRVKLDELHTLFTNAAPEELPPSEGVAE